MRFVFVALLRRTTVESESCVICSMRSSQIAELIAPNVSTNRNCKRTNHYKSSIQIKAQGREKAALPQHSTPKICRAHKAEHICGCAARGCGRAQDRQTAPALSGCVGFGTCKRQTPPTPTRMLRRDRGVGARAQASARALSSRACVHAWVCAVRVVWEDDLHVQRRQQRGTRRE